MAGEYAADADAALGCGDLLLDDCDAVADGRAARGVAMVVADCVVGRGNVGNVQGAQGGCSGGGGGQGEEGGQGDEGEGEEHFDGLSE